MYTCLQLIATKRQQLQVSTELLLHQIIDRR